MKNLLLNNIGLKLLSVLVAFLIWIMVVNVDDPEQTKAFVITEQRIQITNLEEVQRKAEQAQGGKKVYSVVRNENESGNVTVYVTARRSVLDKLRLNDIKVEADMENMTVQTTVPFTVSITGVSTENIKCVPQAMKFVLEDKTEKTYAISLSTSGQPASGYELGEVTLREGDTLIIAGPNSITKTIDKVGVQVEVGGLSSDQVVEASVVITDRNGNNLSKTQMDSLEIKTANGALIKENKVNASVKLWRVQQNIKLRVDVENIQVAEGYRITSTSVNPATINLAGSESTLEALNGELVIEGISNNAAATESIEMNIDLSDYLQEHYKKTLKLETESATAVSVKIQIEKIGTTTINVPVSDFQIIGQPEDMKLVLTPADKVPIEVTSEDSGMGIKAEDIQVVLDLTPYQREGNYTVPLQVTLPEGYSLETEPKVKVSMEKIEVQTETTTVEE